MKIHLKRQCPICLEVFIFTRPLISLFFKHLRAAEAAFELEYAMHYADCRNYHAKKIMDLYDQFLAYVSGVLIMPKNIHDTTQGQFRTFLNYLKKKEAMCE